MHLNFHNHCIFIPLWPIRRYEDTFMSQWPLKVKTTKLPKERDNTDDQVMIGYSFTSEGLREWCKFSGPITEQSKPKLKLSQITLDTLKNFSINTLNCQSERLWEERNRAMVPFMLIFNLSQKHNKNHEVRYQCLFASAQPWLRFSPSLFPSFKCSLFISFCVMCSTWKTFRINIITYS